MTFNPEEHANLGALNQWRESHEELDRERFDSIKDNMADIKITLAAIQIDLKASTQRLHGRVDDEAKVAQGLHDLSGKSIGRVEGKIANLTISFLATLCAGLFGIVVFFVVPFFERMHP